MFNRVVRATIVALSATSMCLPFVAAATSPLPRPTCVLSSPPGSIPPGSTTRLLWYSEHGAQASITPGIGAVSGPSGSVNIHPSVTTLYTMTISNASGSNTCGALVTVTAPNPPTLLTYFPPVVQPVIFTPVTYTSVYVPYGGYGGYYVPYDSIVYDNWYDNYGSRSYSTRTNDFWSYYSRGPSTGPSLFGMMNGSGGDSYRYGDSYIKYSTETLASGDSRTTEYKCVYGMGCEASGMYSSSPVYRAEPEIKIEELPNLTPESRSEVLPQDPPPSEQRPLLIEPGRGLSESELLAPPDWNQPGWTDSLPYPHESTRTETLQVTYTPDEGAYSQGSSGSQPSYVESPYPGYVDVVEQSTYSEPSYYSETSYGI